MKKVNHNEKSGITLVVLVITIIVMAILGGVVIANLDNSNILNDAEGIINDANLNTIKDAADVKYIRYEMNKNLLEEGETVAEYIKRELIEDELLTEQEAKYLFFSNDGEVKRRVFGDVNCDGVVDTADVTLLTGYISGEVDAVTDFGLANSDVDLNGELDPADQSILSRHVANWVEYETLPYIK